MYLICAKNVLRTNCQCLAYSIVFMLCAIQPCALSPGSPQHRLGQPVCLPLGDWVILEPDEPGVPMKSITSMIYNVHCRDPRRVQGPSALSDVRGWTMSTALLAGRGRRTSRAGRTATSATPTSSPPSPCSAASTSTRPKESPCTRSVANLKWHL